MPMSKGNYFNEVKTVSLLSATTGMLEIARIPVVDKPDWIIPQSLILAIDDYDERIWTYLWKNQDVSIYHLLPRGMTPEKIVVVESITDAHRIGLQIQGMVTFHRVRLTDLRDATPEELQHNSLLIPTADKEEWADSHIDTAAHEQEFVFEPVIFEGEVCIVPDLDKLSHYLVDLDS